MRPVSPKRRERRGPGPSRLAYRLSRLWMKAWVRRATTVAVPVLGLVAVGWAVVSDPRTVAAISAQRDAVVDAFTSRPEFSVRGVEVVGASVEVARAVEEVVGLSPGVSSLTLDVAALQERIAELGPVRSAHVGLAPSGVLLITVDERVPEVLWRHGGKLALIDRDGVAIAPAVQRAGYPELPLIVGQGAPQAVAEALDLFAAVPDLRPRIRALVRVGARRWDVLLDRDQRILLPEDGPVVALTRVLAWQYAEELLDRDVAAIDMRLPARPTVRMQPDAAQLYRLRQAADGAGEDT